MSNKIVLKKFEELAELLKDHMSKKEFLANFEKIIAHFTEIKNQLLQEIDKKVNEGIIKEEEDLNKLKKEFQQIIEFSKKESDSTFGGFKTRTMEIINNLFLKSRIEEKINNAIKKVDNKLLEIKDGLDGKDAEPIDETEIAENASKMALNAMKEQKLSIDTIKGLKKKLKHILEELEEIKKRKNNNNVIYTGGGGVGKHNVVAHDLSGSLSADGSVRTFNLPAFWKIISINLSSFPNILRPDVDFTVSGMQIVFTSEVPAMSISFGQTVIILYSE